MRNAGHIAVCVFCTYDLFSEAWLFMSLSVRNQIAGTVTSIASG